MEKLSYWNNEIYCTVLVNMNVCNSPFVLSLVILRCTPVGKTTTEKSGKRKNVKYKTSVKHGRCHLKYI